MVLRAHYFLMHSLHEIPAITKDVYGKYPYDAEFNKTMEKELIILCNLYQFKFHTELIIIIEGKMQKYCATILL